MKKLILSMLLCTLSYAGSVAQSNDVILSAEAEKKCTQITREMADKLMLNEPEYIKLKAINKEYLGKSEELQQQYHNDAAALTAALTELKKETNEKIINLLSPVQETMFADMQKMDKGFMTASSNK